MLGLRLFRIDGAAVKNGEQFAFVRLLKFKFWKPSQGTRNGNLFRDFYVASPNSSKTLESNAKSMSNLDFDDVLSIKHNVF